MRYLIRVAKTRFEEWVNGKGDARVLAESVFQLKKAHRQEYQGLSESSTYLVEGHIEEVRVAAAHLLAGNDPKMESRYLIRILPSDTKEADLQVDDSSIGETGVPWVDFRHRDLIGTKDQFRQLVEIILRCVKEGQDRIRRIGAAQDEFALRHFAGLATKEKPTRTMDVITCVLNGTSLNALNSDIDQAKTELTGLAIPEETVSLRAFCLQRDGKGGGSMRGDWEKALAQLREEYARRYLKAQWGQ